MSEFHVLTLPFEGEPLTTVSWDGRPAWRAREIGRRLGYAQDGKRLVSRIRREWREEFIEGRDYVLLSGEELAAFKAAVEPGTPEVPGRASGLVLLLESGLHLVLTKTSKPIGVRLRRFLVDEVLPQLVRTGTYTPDREVGGLVVTEIAVADPGLAARREERLARQALARERWVDVCDRKLQVDTLHRAVDVLRADGLITPGIAASVELCAAEIATRADLSVLIPVVTPWSSPSEIAARWSVSVQRIGRLLSTLGLRGDVRYSKATVTRRGPHRTVVSFVYNPAAVARIDAALRSTGLEPAGGR